MNKILIHEEAHDNEENGNTNNDESDYNSVIITNPLTNKITGILQDMKHLPDNHPVWWYADPASAYCSIKGIDTNDIDTLNEFIEWYDNFVHVMYDVKNNERNTHHDSVNQVANSEAWGSSTSEPITWGQTKARNHEEKVKLWNESSKRHRQ
jgi:hypothetical protein